MMSQDPLLVGHLCDLSHAPSASKGKRSHPTKDILLRVRAEGLRVGAPLRFSLFMPSQYDKYIFLVLPRMELALFLLLNFFEGWGGEALLKINL